jgi:hypothetical protein
MRRILFDSLMRRPLTEAAPVKDEEMLAELGASVERAARRRLGRSLSIREVDATAVSSRSTRSTTRSMISNASGCTSWPRRGTPTCCS